MKNFTYMLGVCLMLYAVFGIWGGIGTATLMTYMVTIPFLIAMGVLSLLFLLHV